MYTELWNDNTLNFVFDNILLPDSTNNEPESHGYVIYTIDQQSDLSPLEEMTNQAAIYFDFNEAVITNTVLNTIVDPADGVPERTLPELTIFPNPLTQTCTILADRGIEEIILSSLTGERFLVVSTDGTRSTLDIGAFPSGVYMLTALLSDGRKLRRKLVVE